MVLKMPKYRCSFNPEWLENDHYKQWIQKTSSINQAYCRLCSKVKDISNMGESALMSHMKSVKHEKNVRSGCVSVLSLFKASSTASTLSKLPAVKTPSQDLATASSSKLSATSVQIVDCETQSQTIKATSSIIITGQNSMRSYVMGDDTLTTEILWALKAVSAHFSFNSCAHISELFTRLFPDSEIAKKITCGSDKIAYMVTFGLGPHFQDLLKRRLNSSDGFVLLFDESLNRELNKKQMDIHVRYWYGNQVSTYFVYSLL